MVVRMETGEAMAWRRNGRVRSLVSVVPRWVPTPYKTGRRAQLTRYAVASEIRVLVVQWGVPERRRWLVKVEVGSRRREIDGKGRSFGARGEVDEREQGLVKG